MKSAITRKHKNNNKTMTIIILSIEKRNASNLGIGFYYEFSHIEIGYEPKSSSNVKTYRLSVFNLFHVTCASNDLTSCCTKTFLRTSITMRRHHNICWLVVYYSFCLMETTKQTFNAAAPSPMFLPSIIYNEFIYELKKHVD